MKGLFLISSFLLLCLAAQTAAAPLRQCSACHTGQDGGPIRKPLTELCLSCHKDRMRSGEHVVEVIPSRPVPQGFPLTKEGMLTCTTCHDPHSQEPMMLRMQPVALCNECHKK